jgi:hypothetical protein
MEPNPNHLDKFRKEFLQPSTLVRLQDGVPLRLLDALSPEELKIAEEELINALKPGDDWPFRGLGHIKSKKSLPKLYGWLEKSEKGMKVKIAYVIFQISRDKKMIDIALQEIPKVENEFSLIELLHLLPGFEDDGVLAMLDQFRDDKRYLVAYNATAAMALPTDIVIANFRNKGK